jgi:glycosyltransferase involved in cell wall biosynthesis
MSLLTRLRRISRVLPISPALLHRLRRLAGAGFWFGAWVKHGRMRLRQQPHGGPVCVAGFHGSVLGIGEAARACSSALRAAGAEVVDWDVSALFGHDVRLDGTWSPRPPAEAAAMVLYLNPRELVQLAAMLGAAPFRGRFCVGCWAYELERVPADWRRAFRYVDEVWACSGFVARAIAAQAPRDFPVRVLPHPLPASPGRPDRAAFGLPDDKVVVLTVFDVRSGFVRKNPIAAVRAFRLANRSGRAVMRVKAAGGEGAPDLMAELVAEIGEAGDVRLMTDWLTGAQMQSLMASADIILSLHRSEGFGLTPAQGMAAGKAVVATGWSGNLDFMTEETAALVEVSFIPVRDPQNLYDGGRWAKPDVEEAAAKLRTLIEDDAARQALGARAAAHIIPLLDPLALGRMARGWLQGG